MAKLMAGRILGERSAREWKGLKETRGAGRNAHPQPPGLAERTFIEKILEIRGKGRNVWLYGCTAAKKEAVTFGWLPRSRCSGESELGATSEYTWLGKRPGPPPPTQQGDPGGEGGGGALQAGTLPRCLLAARSGASRGRVDNLRRHQPAMTAPACWHPPNPDLTSDRSKRHKKVLISL